jgi:Ca-activated chloride channel family protein
MMQRHNNRQKDYFIPVLAIVLVAVTSSLWPQPSRANAEVLTSPDQFRSGGLLLRRHEGYAIATTLNTVLDIEANGLVARVSVRQTFRNDGQQWVEGVYVFPLPDNAAVDRIKLHIGERFIEGEIRQKEKARKEYERAKKAGKKASLVNQQRANLFTTAIANIAPGETVTVEIEYQQTIGFDEGIFSLRFPLTLTPRYVPGVPTGDRKGSGWAADTRQVSDASLITPPFVTSSAGHKVTMIAKINAGMALDFVASRYHPVNVDEKNGTYRVTLSGQDVPMDHDLELIWRPNASSVPRALVFSENHDKQTHLLLLLVPPSDTDVPVVSTPRELVFVIDTSGSMHGTSIDQARKALLLALDGLRPSDRFNVIQFNSVTHALFPDPADASLNRVQLARRYVRQLQANGGTEMRPALEKALRYKPDEQYLRQIIFITDGSVANEDALFRLIEKELGNARMFTVGIGSAPNGWFMSKAAEVGRGTYTFISAQHEVNEKMASLFRKLEQPQVTNIDVQWPHGMTVDAYPKKVPDLYNGEPVILRVRLEHEPQVGDNLIIGGDTVMGRWQAEVPLATRAGSAGIATLWARARIADLEDRQRRGEDRETVRMAIAETALSHHLVSRHTSLVAVDKTPVREASEALGKSQLSNLLPHGQNHQAIIGFAATATTAPLNRIIGASCLILAMFVWLGRVMGYGHGRLA